MKLICGYAGRVKDFRPIFAKKEDLPEPPEKVENKNHDTHILPQNMKKSNYSVVCRRCNRKLTSEVSRNRGYGSYCYRKAREEKAKEKVRKEIEGQIDMDELAELVKEVKR
ncbi:DUF6011 domain-containing protein [Sporanaerobacter sp. PP17-6a]|uniref:DUF6011 domain-containing protein n=1 Tax=Sporanaerobacter sp. PP17-6a TaxID=1891289 RepID=UPI00089FF415|nr:DUF6011 domain-containing protein [Sporanaerobacter sp. PP17-6a]SCL85006.1 hypothetical protein PP176A_0777 [Sporanaerobacter sp. PP17-6a]